MEKCLEIPYTGDEFIDGLMERLDREFSDRPHAHRPISEIQEQAYNYFIQFDPTDVVASAAAESVAKNRRSQLDKSYLERAMQFVRGEDWDRENFVSSEQAWEYATSNL